MKAARFSEFGLPQEVLKIEELPIPQPGPGEVLIRLQSRPINPADLFQIMGIYGIKPQLPAVGGMEGAGVIEQVGEGVELQIGQKVVPLKTGSGTWQEYVVAKAVQVIPVPDELSVETASTVVVNPLSAYLMTREIMKVPAGEWLVQTAAGSALGQMVIQLSKVYGFKTINLVRRREQFDELTALGADACICTSDEIITRRIQEITDGAGVKYAIDAVAGKIGSQVANALTVGGTLLIYGALDQEGLLLNPGSMIFKQLTIKGFWLSRWIAEAAPEQRLGLIQAVLPLVMSGKIQSPIAARYNLDDIAQAVTHAQQAARGGKILIVG